MRDATSDAPREIVVKATEAECDRVAARLKLPHVAALSCRYELYPEAGGTIFARGALTARLSQVCVLSLEEFEDVIGERFSVRFVPASQLSSENLADPAGEFDEIDEIPYEDDTIDFGEATIEQLSLVLDPYPRRPGVARPEGVMDEDDVVAADDIAESSDLKTNPFAALSRLRKDRG